jgi:hypothetical protein
VVTPVHPVPTALAIAAHAAGPATATRLTADVEDQVTIAQHDHHPHDVDRDAGRCAPRPARPTLTAIAPGAAWLIDPCLAPSIGSGIPRPGLRRGGLPLGEGTDHGAPGDDDIEGVDHQRMPVQRDIDVIEHEHLVALHVHEVGPCLKRGLPDVGEPHVGLRECAPRSRRSHDSHDEGKGDTSETSHVGPLFAPGDGLQLGMLAPRNVPFAAHRSARP